jgi:hypothetical protein
MAAESRTTALLQAAALTLVAHRPPAKVAANATGDRSRSFA